MRRAPFCGGCLSRGAASRPALPLLTRFPWITLHHRHCRGGKQRATASSREDRGVNPQPLALEHVLEQLRKTQGIDRLGPNVEAVVSGRGKHLGIAVSWSLRWTSAGSFAEEIRGPQLTFKWGYNGRKDSGCWEVDSSGLVRVMECDDHEAVLMTTYIRTGCWLQPHLRDRFEMELLPAPVLVPSTFMGGSSSSRGGRDGHGARGGLPAVDEANAAGSSSSSTSSTQGSRSAGAPAAATAAARSGGGAGSRKALAVTHGSPARHVLGSAPSADDAIALGLRVRGRKLRVRVLVRRRDWRLLGFDHRMCADVETWELGEWKEWADGVHYPTSALHKASNGGQHAYLTSAGAAEQVAPLLLDPAAAAILLAPPLAPPEPTDFCMPLLPPIPGDTSYSLPQRGGQAVPLWRAASGHFLVRPAINGQEGGGYFVLDTGASGFVVTPQAAARLGGQSFGETHAASISGKVAARFVRLGSWALGGLEIRQPVLMVMGLEGLVRGAPGEVVGIVGHDLFRRAVLELPQLRGGGPPPAAANDASGASGSEWRFGSSSDSGSGSEDEYGALPREAASAAPLPPSTGSYAATPPFGPPPQLPRSTPAFPEGPPAGVASSSRSSSGGGGGGGDGRAERQACGVPPLSVAVAAVPSPALEYDAPAAAGMLPSPSMLSSSPTPSSSSSSSSSSASGARSTHGSTAACPAAVEGRRGLDTSSSTPPNRAGNDRDCSSSSVGSFSSGSGGEAELTSRTSRNSSSSSSDSGSSSSSSSSGTTRGDSSVGSSNGSGGGSGVRTSLGRSATARAVRRAARTVPYTLHEMVLHHPLEYGKESEWVWEPLVMIANLPHVHLRFADPAGGPPRAALLMVDSGACGADLMLHARAQRELRLEPGANTAGVGAGADGSGGGTGTGGSSRSQGHYLRGVGQDPSCFVQLQVLDLPWLEMAGVRFEQVRCMCAAVGGLDISIYSHGILCGDLLARLEWAIDYTHKRIGFRRGATAPAPRASSR